MTLFENLKVFAKNAVVFIAIAVGVHYGYMMNVEFARSILAFGLCVGLPVFGFALFVYGFLLYKVKKEERVNGDISRLQRLIQKQRENSIIPHSIFIVFDVLLIAHMVYIGAIFPAVMFSFMILFAFLIGRCQTFILGHIRSIETRGRVFAHRMDNSPDPWDARQLGENDDDSLRRMGINVR